VISGAGQRHDQLRPRQHGLLGDDDRDYAVPARHRGGSSYVELGEELFRKQIARLVYPESRALINAHRARGPHGGHHLFGDALPGGPAAADLGIENVLCTQLEVEDGVFTGNVVRPTCFGQGKVDAAEVLAERASAGRLANASSTPTAPTTSCCWSRSVTRWP
jgi:hypothetical protein